MHSAIFSVIDVTDGDLTEEEIEDIGTPYEAYELQEKMGSIADYVQDDAGSWEPENLTNHLKQYPFIKILGGDTFEILKSDGYISEEIKRRIKRIQKLLEEQEHDDALTFYRACKIMDDDSSFYIISMDREGDVNDFQTKDEFILDAFNAGKKYKVVGINDYHM